MHCKYTLSAVLGFCMGCAAFFESAASAEPIGTLFGVSLWSEPAYNRSQNAVYPAYGAYPRAHVQTKRRHVQRKVNPYQDSKSAVRQSELATRLATMQKLKPGTLDVFLSDPTLRRSDAVMTIAGIFIFQGNAGDHSQKDFVPLARTKPIAHRAELAAIQRVSLQHFEVAQLEQPRPNKTFENIRQATKTFETIEPKAIRRIAGIESF